MCVGAGGGIVGLVGMPVVCCGSVLGVGCVGVHELRAGHDVGLWVGKLLELRGGELRVF